MIVDWRKIPQRERPYNAYRRPRYVEGGCDHNGPYCKCDPPMWLRPPSLAEEAREFSMRPASTVAAEPK